MSVATAWEIATKYRLGKLPEAEAMAYDNVSVIALQGFGEMPVSVEHGDRAGSLPGLHRDPFDRMLIAQALVSDSVLVSNESLFHQYGVRRLW